MAMKNNGTLRLIGVVTAIVVVLASVGASYVGTKNTTDTTKVEGCLPARENTKSIIRLQKDVSYTKKRVDEIKDILEKTK